MPLIKFQTVIFNINNPHY